MYLKTIKLSGFKSFVDPTNIPIRSNLTGIVGPNGCGKSNVVDAVRWVIGEISAKQLRGQSMADVIFNGTSGRKPVGKAGVELIFDNSSGRIGGEYARFNEIAIRREVERDGQSNYYINSVNCRRRDVLDLFLGTGLGPRSYAIIEQGMISQLIEAKPEDLRVYFEEVAGISKYRERRRETEQRMRNTQENLDRLNDLRAELEKQLRHLKRQANAAERYKELKEEERLLQAQIVARQWQNLGHRIQEQEMKISQSATHHEELVAHLRQTEMEIEKARLWQTELNDKQNGVQKNYYELGGEIARIEQQIKHIEDQSSHWQKELEQAQNLSEEVSENSSEYREQIDELTLEIESLKPQSFEIKQIVQTSKQQLSNAEILMNQWQGNWDEFQTASSQTLRQVEVAKTKIEHFDRQLNQLTQRVQSIQQQQSNQEITVLSDEVAIFQNEVQQFKDNLQTTSGQLEQIKLQINNKHDHHRDLNRALQQLWQELQALESQFASLDALQQTALGMKDDNTHHWLATHQLQQNPRLGQKMRVLPGWELAVETILSGAFEAVCVDSINEYLQPLSSFNQGRLILLDKSSSEASQSQLKAKRLIDCVECEWPLDQWLSSIFIANDLTEAQQLKSQLAPHESVITQEGIWIGPNWIRISKKQENNNSVLLREQELNRLRQEVNQKRSDIDHQAELLKLSESELRQLETDREMLHQNYQSISAQLVSIQTQLSSKQSRRDGLVQQQQRLKNELEECTKQHQEIETQISQAKLQFAEAQETQLTQTTQRELLIAKRDECRMQLENARNQSQRDQQRADEIEIRLSSNDSQLAVLKQTITQAERQLQQLENRINQLQSNLAETGEPLNQLKVELQRFLEQRLTVETELRTIENELQSHQLQLKQYESNRQKTNAELNVSQNQLQELRMEHQALSVRQTTLKEKITESNFNLEELLSSITESIPLEEWEERLRQVETRITRLGPINLAAIEEHQQINERKEYLDKQHQDLSEALEVLHEAIRKIDRETKVKFRDTIDQVNEQFQFIFPKVFGGGRTTSR